MATSSDHPCRTALVDALALLDLHGHSGAACYVAMALDSLDDSGSAFDAAEPPVRVAVVRRQN